MIIAVDFDGTLCEHSYPDIGKPNYKAISKLREMQKHGNRLILWTCRSGETLREAVCACEEWGLVFDAVNENINPSDDFNPRKVCADIYLDDRALNILDFCRR